MKGNAILVLLLAGVVFGSACTQGAAAQSPLPRSVQQQESGQIVHPSGNSVGSVQPDFTVTTTDGRTLRFSEYSAEKPTVLYFMATWCPFCKQDFAALEGVYPDYQDRINFLAVSLDTTENAQILRQYRAGRYVPGDLAPGTQGILIDYGVRSTTTKFLVRDNEIIFKNSGAMSADNWRQLFNALLS